MGRVRREGVESGSVSLRIRGHDALGEQKGTPLLTRARSSDGVRNLTSMTCVSGSEIAEECVFGLLLMPFTTGMEVR